MRVLITSILFCFLLSACGNGQEEAMAPEKSTGTTASKDKGSDPMASASGETIDGTFYPDHEKDAREFEVRSALAGVNRMIESYKKDGHATSELEKRKAELEKELADL